MDKKLLEALNNLSFALDTISDILSKKGDKKSDTAKALSSADLSKQFEALNKSLKDNIEESRKESKKTKKDLGFDTLSKQMNQLGSSVNELIKNNNKILSLQKSLSEMKPEVVIKETTIKIPKIKPIEVPLRYGKLEPLKLPIPKPITISFNKPTLPTLPTIKFPAIDLKFSKLPTLPKLPQPLITIGFEFSEIPKLPTLQNLVIQVEYGKLPNLPELKPFDTQLIPFDYGKSPILPTLDSFDEQIIPIKYGDVPTLPKLGSVQEVIVPISYGDVPELPIPKVIPPQVVDIMYGDTPVLPTLNQIPPQIIQLNYGNPILPKLAKIDDQIISVKYGEIPTLPELAKFETQIVGISYGPIPQLPELAKIPTQLVSIDYIIPNQLPELAKFETQVIPISYGDVPTLPELGKIEEQLIPISYGELPGAPSLPVIPKQVVELLYGQVPKLPTIDEIPAQIIPINYGPTPNLPKLANFEKQVIPIEYGETPTLPKLVGFEPQIIEIKYGNIPKVPISGEIKQTIDLRYGILPELPKLAQFEEQVISLKYGEIPSLPKLTQFEDQTILVKYGEIPSLPELGKMEPQLIPLSFGEVPNYPPLKEIPPQVIQILYGDVPKIPTLDTISPQIISLNYGNVPTLPELAKIDEQMIPLKYGQEPPLELTEIQNQIIPLIYGEVPKIPTLEQIPTQIISLNYGPIPTLPKLAEMEQLISLRYGEVPTSPKLSEFDEQIIPLKYGEQPSLELEQIDSQVIPLIYSGLPNLPTFNQIPAQTISLNYGVVPTLPKLAKFEAQQIELKYGNIPTLPELAKFEDQVIGLKYGEVPTLPELAQTEQVVPIKYGEVPTLPELAKFEDQVIGLKYGEVPTLPELAQTEQVVPIKYGEVPTLPELAKFEDQVIGLKYGEVPTLPKLSKFEAQEIPVKWGKLDKIQKFPKIPTQEVPLKWSKIPKLTDLPKIKSQEIELKYSKLPKLPKIAKPNTLIIPVQYGKLNKLQLPKPGKVIIPTEYGKPKGKVTQTNDGGVFGKAGDPKMKESIKSGISMILLIAGAVVAIGLAFKLVGGINFASVVGLSIAISLLAVAFAKLAEQKELTPKKVLGLTAVLVGISLAVMLSSLILRGVKPIGIFQLLTAIFIAGMFTVISYGLGKLLTGISNISPKGILMLPLLPFIMVGISLAITLSSHILRGVKPIGLFQAITAILIAGVFAVISYGLGNLLVGLGKMGVKSMIFIPLLPIILVSISLAILGSSFLLAKVKPIGLFQAITAIFIGAVFAAVSYGLGQIIKGIGSVKNPAQAMLIAAMLPILMVAISAAIMVSSHLFAMIKPVGLFQLLTAIFIGVALIPISYAVGPIAKAVKNLNVAQMAKIPVVMVAMAVTIMLTSYIFQLVKPVSMGKLLSVLGISIVIGVIGLGMGKVLPQLARYKEKTIMEGGKNLLIIAGVIAASSLILGIGQYKKYPTFEWLFFVSLSMVAFGGAIVSLDKLKLTQSKIEKGAKSIIILAATIVATSLILSVGQYTKFPSFTWLMYTSLSMVAFGGAILALDKLKLTQSKIEKGAKSILIIAATLVATSFILSVGIYNKYPSLTWTFHTAISLATFGLAFFALDKLKLTQSKVQKGAVSILIIAATLMATSLILSVGIYNKYPSIEWVMYSAISMVAFGFAIYILDKVGLTPATALKGSIAILLIAATIMATSLILSVGNYTKYPSFEWTLGTAAAMIPFGIAAVLLGTIAASGAGAVALLAGLVSIIAIAGTILAVDFILSKGDFTKPVPINWTLSTVAIMAPFGLAAVFLGPLLPLIILGATAIIAVAATVLATDYILSKGDYTKPVPINWTTSTIAIMAPFALAAAFLGPFLPLLALGGLAIVGISYVVVKTAEILSGGKYDKYPSVDWAKGVGLTLAEFATGMGALGAIIAGTLGLGAVALAAGGDAVLGVAETVVKASNILSKGNYTAGPTLQWASGVAIALGAFSEVYKMLMANAIFEVFGGGGIGPKEFGESIVMISQSINSAGDQLSRGNFTGGPKFEWAQGVAIAIGAFSSVYKMLLDNAGPSFFASGVSPEQFSTAIVTIAQGITTAAMVFSMGSVAYKMGPTKEWSEGVSLALGGFAPIYKILVDNAGIWKSGVSVDDFKNAIVSISSGIVVAAAILATGTTSYKMGPTKTWAEGVSTALQAFTGVFQALGANSSWFKGSLKPEDYQNAIKSVGMGLAEAAKAISGSDVSYDLNKVPKKEWGQAVSDTFQAFIPALKYINEQSGWFSDGAETTVTSMKAIAQAIADTGNTLSGGNFTTMIDPKWGRGIKISFDYFVIILKSLNESEIDMDSDGDFFKLQETTKTVVSISHILASGNYKEIPKGYMEQLHSNMTNFLSLMVDVKNSEASTDEMDLSKQYTQGIVDISQIISKGNYSVMIPENWMKSMRLNLVSFSQMLSGFKSGGLFSFFEDSVKEKVNTLAEGIIELAKIFNDNKVPFDVRRVPSAQWSQGFSMAMNAIMPGLNYISQNNGIFSSGEDKFKSGLLAIAEGLVQVSRKLAQGRFNTMINPNYFKNLSQNITSYLNILKSVEEADADYDNVADMADSMVELAKAYDKLGEAVMKLNGQLGGVDVEKMTLLKNLAGSVVMLSLMDSDQFGSMMDALEDKAKILLEVMDDTKTSAPKEAETKPAAGGGATKPGGGATKGVTSGGAGGGAKVKTPEVKKSAPPKESESDKMMMELAKSMSSLSSAVAGINSVISGEGVSLKTYIASKMKSTRNPLGG